MLSLLKADGIEPRSPQAIADAVEVAEANVVGALAELEQARLVRKLAKATYYPIEQLERAEQAALAFLSAQKAITVAELRDRLGTSRKYSQAILAHLDREGATVRRGDVHYLRRSRSRQ